MYFRSSKPKRYLTYFVCVVIIPVVSCSLSNNLLQMLPFRFMKIFLLFSVYWRSDTSSTTNGRHTEPFENDILLTQRRYDSQYLHKWIQAPAVPHIYDLPGELGRPVHIDSKEAKKRFKEHQFNVVACEMISVNRSLSDVRDPQCIKLKYQSTLPTTSIIIIFHNEAWCTLVRSLWSIINRSSRELVKEIILVDDKSTFPFLGNDLDKYVRTLPIHIKIVRMVERFGIVKARLFGASYAQGEVITFLDAHIECAEGWLEPLLSRITDNRRIVAAPVIDIIKDNTFEYVAASDELWGGFDWKLFYKWVQIPQRERERTENSMISPLHTPTIAGGIFAIDKEFFFEIGSYDDGMLIWGSENLEMSFRVWMCGGILEQIPCSRVGHVYRRKTPYSLPGGEANKKRNKHRLLDVWLDDWITFYNALNPDHGNKIAGDVSDRVALRKKLNCKNFQWYVDNIYPEIDLRTGTKYIGQIQNIDSQHCLAADQENKDAVLYGCEKRNANQIFLLTKRNEIRNYGLCLDAVVKSGNVKVLQCHDMKSNQEWMYDEQTMTFRHYSGSCLQRDNQNEPLVNVKLCDGSKRQQWILINEKSKLKS